MTKLEDLAKGATYQFEGVIDCFEALGENPLVQIIRIDGDNDVFVRIVDKYGIVDHENIVLYKTEVKQLKPIILEPKDGFKYGVGTRLMRKSNNDIQRLVTGYSHNNYVVIRDNPNESNFEEYEMSLSKKYMECDTYPNYIPVNTEEQRELEAKNEKNKDADEFTRLVTKAQEMGKKYTAIHEDYMQLQATLENARQDYEAARENARRFTLDTISKGVEE